MICGGKCLDKVGTQAVLLLAPLLTRCHVELLLNKQSESQQS